MNWTEIKFNANVEVLKIIYENVSLSQWGEVQPLTTEEEIEKISKHYKNAMKLIDGEDA